MTQTMEASEAEARLAMNARWLALPIEVPRGDLRLSTDVVLAHIDEALGASRSPEVALEAERFEELAEAYVLHHDVDSHPYSDRSVERYGEPRKGWERRWLDACNAVQAEAERVAS